MIELTEPLSSRMLIGRDRLFYSGLLGSTKGIRRLGAMTIYTAHARSFDIKIGKDPWQSRRIIALPAFTQHQLRSPNGYITAICLEPETIDPVSLKELASSISDGPEDAQLIRRIQAARREISTIRDAGGFSTREFDRYFLRQNLKPREIDPRIQIALGMLLDDLQDQAISASTCAAEIGLSTSRFLHLYKENTDMPFRSQRMWKRARRFMDHANQEDSLTDVALDLGYPDSSHFSHSIRALFGMQPRSIREGSRGMQVCLGENYAMSGGVA